MLKILAEEIVSQRCSFYFQDPVKAPPQKGTVTYSIYSYCTAPPPPPYPGHGQWTVDNHGGKVHKNSQRTFRCLNIYQSDGNFFVCFLFITFWDFIS